MQTLGLLSPSSPCLSSFYCIYHSYYLRLVGPGHLATSRQWDVRGGKDDEGQAGSFHARVSGSSMLGKGDLTSWQLSQLCIILRFCGPGSEQFCAMPNSWSRDGRQHQEGGSGPKDKLCQTSQFHTHSARAPGSSQGQVIPYVNHQSLGSDGKPCQSDSVLERTHCQVRRRN